MRWHYLKTLFNIVVLPTEYPEAGNSFVLVGVNGNVYYQFSACGRLCRVNSTARYCVSRQPFTIKQSADAQLRLSPCSTSFQRSALGDHNNIIFGASGVYLVGLKRMWLSPTPTDYGWLIRRHHGYHQRQRRNKLWSGAGF
jgi:hypothetical protein